MPSRCLVEALARRLSLTFALVALTRYCIILLIMHAQPRFCCAATAFRRAIRTSRSSRRCGIGPNGRVSLPFGPIPQHMGPSSAESLPSGRFPQRGVPQPRHSAVFRNARRTARDRGRGRAHAGQKLDAVVPSSLQRAAASATPPLPGSASKSPEVQEPPCFSKRRDHRLQGGPARGASCRR